MSVCVMDGDSEDYGIMIDRIFTRDNKTIAERRNRAVFVPFHVGADSPDTLSRDLRRDRIVQASLSSYCTGKPREVIVMHGVVVGDVRSRQNVRCGGFRGHVKRRRCHPTNPIRVERTSIDEGSGADKTNRRLQRQGPRQERRGGR